uniref:Uncharacterized protein n=1 Tax=Arundo donax TaxID=35708 RepID=A0A0A9AI98_ARUDO
MTKTGKITSIMYFHGSKDNLVGNSVTLFYYLAYVSKCSGNV